MIYLLYGSNVVQSRNFLFSLKEKASNNSVRIYSEVTDLDFVKQQISNIPLFSNSNTVIFESNKELAIKNISDLEFLNSLEKDTTVIFWIGSDIKKTNLLLKFAQKSKDFRISAFNSKETDKIFILIDQVISKNKDSYITLNAILEKESEAVLLLNLLSSSIRNMLGIKKSASYVNTLHPFVKTKLSKYANMFEEEFLENVLEKVYDTDLKIKTSSVDIKSEMFKLISYIIS